MSASNHNENGRAGESSHGCVSDPQFAALYEKAYPQMRMIAAAMTGDRSVADDLVQEAAMIAFGKRQQFAVGSNFAAWFGEIVRHCAQNHLRKRNRRKTYPTDTNSMREVPQKSGYDRDAVPISFRTGEIVDSQTSFDDNVLQALNSLSADARCCLLLRTVHGLSYREIAELVDLPQGTVLSHVHRSKAEMRRRLSACAPSSDTQVAN